MNTSQRFLGAKHFRRNYILGIANGVLFNLTFALLSPETILPAFLSRLTSSSLLIGVGSIMEEAAWLLPQAFVARYVQPLERKKTVYVIAAFFRSLTFGLLTLSIFLLGQESRQLLLVMFFILFTIYSFAGGIAGVPFMDIVGKAIPPQKRGSFFGYRISLGRALGFVAGLTVVKEILTAYDYPHNYGTLFLMAFFLITIALIIFCMVKEPVQPVTVERRSLGGHLARGLHIIRNDTNYRRFLIFRLLIGFHYMGLPFYIVYALRVMGISEAMVGIFLAVEMAGRVLSNLLWGWLSNRVGNRLVVRLTSLMAFIAPFFGLESIYLHIPVSVYMLAFFLLGTVTSGLRVGYNNYLLEISPAEERPTYVGLMNTFIAPTVFLAGVGGLVIDLFSYRPLFSIVAIFTFASFLLSMKLEEPRKLTTIDVR